MIIIIVGLVVILFGIADAVLIAFNVPVGPVHDAVIIVASGALLVGIGLVRMKTNDSIRITVLLAGVSTGCWAIAASELVARMIVENWTFVLAFALVQGPIFKIGINRLYGSRFRAKVVRYMKEEGALNSHKTRIANRLVKDLPIEESAGYAISASAVATALFMNEFNLTVNSATTAAFICATTIGTAFYAFHPSVDEIRMFHKNPKGFF